MLIRGIVWRHLIHSKTFISVFVCNTAEYSNLKMYIDDLFIQTELFMSPYRSTGGYQLIHEK